MPSCESTSFCKLAFMPRPPKADKSEQPEFGRRLELAIAHAKKSRKELADHLGISPQSVGQVINGPTVAMTADNSARSAAYLGVSGYWLATGEGTMLESGISQDALRHGETDFLDALRLLDEPERDDFYANLVQMVLHKHGPILDAVKRLQVSTRANDQSVTDALGGVPKTDHRPSARVIEDKPKPQKSGTRRLK